MLKAIVFTVCLTVALGWFAYQLWGRIGLLRAAAGPLPLDHLGERLKAVLVIAFGQKKFIRPAAARQREALAGWAHFLIFWAFVVLLIQIVTLFSRAYVPDFNLPLLAPTDVLGQGYAFVRDVIEATVTGVVVVLLARWGITHPRRLMGFAPAEVRVRAQRHWEAYLVLVFIGLIMLGGLVYDGSRLITHAGDPAWAGALAWSPVSTLIGRGLLAGGPNVPPSAGSVAWWTHNLVVLAFLNFLPIAKHFHVITSLPNVFFRNLAPAGALAKQDLDTATRFGTSRIDQFTRKQFLDMFSCTECGRCSSNCPATATKKPLAPRQLILDLRNYAYAHQTEMIDKRLRHPVSADDTPPEVGENIVGPVIEDEVLWSCNVCGACEEACPVMIGFVDKVVDMRRHLVQEEARFPAELIPMFRGMETQANPWGLDARLRFDWALGQSIPTVADKPDAEYLYFVGCASSFDERNKKTTQAFTRILQAAGVDFACLGSEETCNGETARRLGNEYLYQKMTTALIDTFARHRVKKILVNCPHCFNTLQNEYPQFGGHYEVVHAAAFVDQLVRQNRLRLAPGDHTRTVYHDSCYYGRFNDIYDEPRDLLRRSGAGVVEVNRNKHFGTCCGAGGGRMWLEERSDQRVNLLRTEQLLESQPEVVAVSCPFCMIMLADGISAKNVDDTVRALDVMEIVDRARQR
ncbi:MAG: (Fe-S)-binding protein [bacterium]